ncbi:MAG TPA: hypothetical protein VEZ41_08840 [Allosphingosinicella sp.]|nr:hypothetical protein [Allosphingosinicella sp.]
MSDDRKASRPPLTEDQNGPLAQQGWHAGATFFNESGGRPAQAEGREASRGAGGGDTHLPASESGTGAIPEDTDRRVEDVDRPASEADTAPLQEDDGHGETESWPGSSFGSIPPPG